MYKYKYSNWEWDMGKIVITKVQKKNMLNTNQIIHDLVCKGYVHGLSDQEFNLILSSAIYLSDLIAQLNVEGEDEEKKILSNDEAK